MCFLLLHWSIPSSIGGGLFSLQQLHLLSWYCRRCCRGFFFSVRLLCLTVFHYFQCAICHGVCRPLCFISVWCSWYKAVLIYSCISLLFWIQYFLLRPHTCLCVSIPVLRNMPFSNWLKCHLMWNVKTFFMGVVIVGFFCFYFEIDMFHLASFLFAISICIISRWMPTHL